MFDTKEYAGDIQQYECKQYTINEPGEILICSKDKIKVIRKDEKVVQEIEAPGSKDKIKVIQKDEKEVEVIEAPHCAHKAYRECNQEQQSAWEKYYKPILTEVVVPLVSAGIGAAGGGGS